MTRAVVASVDIPRDDAGGRLPTVALLGFHGGLSLARPVDASLGALTDLLLDAGIAGAHVLVDLPLSGTEGPVDRALARAGLPPRFWKEEALHRGRTLASAIKEAVDDVQLFESSPWAALRVLWALRARRRLAKLGEEIDKPLLDERLSEADAPALANPYDPPAPGSALKRVAQVIEEALSLFGLNITLEPAAGADDAEEAIRVAERCRALLGLLVGSLLRRRSPLVMTLTEVDPPLALLVDPYLRERLTGAGA